MTEQELTRAILDALEARGIWAWRNNTGVAKANGCRIAFGKVGSGDIVGVLPGGRHLELEVKLPTAEERKLTDVQKAHGAKVVTLGGVWAVVKSVEDALAVIRDAMKGRAA